MIDLYARMDAIISEYAGDKVADVMAEASRRLRATEEEPSVTDISEKLRHAAETDAVENGESVRTRLLRDAAWFLDAYAVDVEALDQKCSALAVAHGPNTCGCSYDRPEDICAAHSPQLMEARARLEALEKAAAPFVAEAKMHPPHGACDEARPFIRKRDSRVADITVGDLRALARAAGGGE